MNRRPCPHCEHEIPTSWDLCLYCGKDVEPIIETHEEIATDPLVITRMRMMF